MGGLGQGVGPQRHAEGSALQRVSGSQGGPGSAPEEEGKAEGSREAASQPPDPCSRGREEDA